MVDKVIDVDFNEWGMYGQRIALNPNSLGGPEALLPGERVILRDPGDFQVEGIVQFDEQLGMWFGLPDWSTRRSLFRWVIVPEDETGPDVVSILREALQVQQEVRGVPLEVTYRQDFQHMGAGERAFPEGQTYTLLTVSERTPPGEDSSG